jgi:putative membrane protein
MGLLRHANFPGLSVLSVALFFGSFACGGESSNESAKNASTTTLTEEPPSSPQVSATTSATTSRSVSATGTTTSPAVPATEQHSSSTETSALSDSQIAELASDVNHGELDQARYAIAHATDGRVKAFAQHMLTAHTSIGAKMGTTLKAQNITTSDSSQSLSLKSDAQQTLTSLKGKSGNDFDRAYMDAQVTEHQAALDLFDSKLIPNAQNAPLKESLKQVRPMIAEHLQDAKNIQGSLSAK